jgi:flagellar basal body-associated protein FliL
MNKRKEGKEVKQIIVMISMIILGIAIASFVMGFKSPAENIAKSAAGQLTLETITKPASLK